MKIVVSMALRVCVWAICLATAGRAVAADSLVTPGSRVAVVGDSITEQKLYSKYIECYLLACSGVPDVKVFQYGWSGERAPGFAGRLENDLAGFKPTVVTLCYGMNDGSYQPYNDQIGGAYESAMRDILKKLPTVGVKSVVVGSPGAVDTKFFGTRPAFGTRNSAEGYNDNLAHLRDIDRKLATEYKQAFANVHDAMIDSMKKAKATLGDDYDVCGRDGFHPGPNGQLAMAYAFLKGLGVDGNIGEITVDLKGASTASNGHKVLSSEGGKVELESSRWPFCFEGDDKSSGGTRSITPFLPFNEDLNRLTLKVKGLTGANAKVTWGATTKEFSREQLEKGVNLNAEFAATPFDAAFGKLSGAVANKQNFETYLIKEVVTRQRFILQELKGDEEFVAANKLIATKLHGRQAQLDAEARATLVPVKHVISISQ